MCSCGDNEIRQSSFTRVEFDTISLQQIILVIVWRADFRLQNFNRHYSKMIILTYTVYSVRGGTMQLEVVNLVLVYTAQFAGFIHGRPSTSLLLLHSTVYAFHVRTCPFLRSPCISRRRPFICTFWKARLGCIETYLAKCSWNFFTDFCSPLRQLLLPRSAAQWNFHRIDWTENIFAKSIWTLGGTILSLPLIVQHSIEILG